MVKVQQSKITEDMVGKDVSTKLFDKLQHSIILLELFGALNKNISTYFLNSM